MTTADKTKKIFLEEHTIDGLAEVLAARVVSKMQTDCDTLDIRGAAEFLGVSIPTVNRLKAKGQIPFRKIASRVVFLRSELSQWLTRV